MLLVSVNSDELSKFPEIIPKATSTGFFFSVSNNE